MNRRKFLIGSVATAAAALPVVGRAQAQQPPAAGQGAAPGRGRAGGGRGGPAPVGPEKLARIAIMSLNHGALLKLPWNTTPTEIQTLTLFDLPQYYIDNYGVRNVEFQHTHL